MSFSSSLIPEKPLLVSPSLAATIGLEEATLLSVLDELMRHGMTQDSRGYRWLTLQEASLAQLLPFWTDHDLQRISKSLSDKGILLLASAPYCSSRELTFAFNETAEPATAAEAYRPAPPPAREPEPRTGPGTMPRRPMQQSRRKQGNGLPIVDPLAQRQPQAHNRLDRGANRIAPNWQPSDDLLGQLAQHNVPPHFAHEQLPEFITYWRERGEAHHSWGSKFLKQVLRKWREQQTDVSRRDQEIRMYAEWRPSPDALEILTRQAAVNAQFVHDAIPEFVLYWQERGEVSRAWNSKFIQHVRNQWARYSSALEHDTQPRRIPENWQPSEDVNDVLRLANIDLDYAQQLLPEFNLFWRDSNRVYASWNTKFLQHIKYHWARRHSVDPSNADQISLTHGSNTHTAQAAQDAGQQNAHRPSRTRDRSLVEDLTDRSWAG